MNECMNSVVSRNTGPDEWRGKPHQDHLDKFALAEEVEDTKMMFCTGLVFRCSGFHKNSVDRQTDRDTALTAFKYCAFCLINFVIHRVNSVSQRTFNIYVLIMTWL